MTRKLWRCLTSEDALDNLAMCCALVVGVVVVLDMDFD